MRVRLEPVNVCIDVEAVDTIACVAKARAAMDGTDSGSPTAVAYDPERAET